MSPDGPSIQFEVKVAGDTVLLYRHDYFLRKHEFVPMTPDEAWDLGDDLLIAASRVWTDRGVNDLLLTEQPRWLTDVAIHTDEGYPQLFCVLCQDIFGSPTPLSPLGQVMDMAREHWASVHPYVAQDAEGEDGDAHADPAVPEAELKAQAVGDAHGGGDYVEKDGHGT